MIQFLQNGAASAHCGTKRHFQGAENHDLGLVVNLPADHAYPQPVPGSGAINTMSTGISHGYRGAAASIAGLQVGLSAHIVLVGIGLGALISQSLLAFELLKWLGAAYGCGSASSNGAPPGRWICMRWRAACRAAVCSAARCWST